MCESTKPTATYIGADGQVTARVTMSPSSNKVRAEVEAPPYQAIPIVFVPGIMGSPLLATGDNVGMVQGKSWAWFPDRTSWLIKPFDSYRTLSPIERKKLLDPLQTRALSMPKDAEREIVSEHVTVLPVEEALNRGWGSVMLGSYGKILNALEVTLRFILTPEGKPYPAILAAKPYDASRWGQLKGYIPLTLKNLRYAAEFRYPVYAVGYNWLNSNAQAADYLAERIKAILKRCESELSTECKHGVILVTHSMGGLVARMCAKRNPSLIQGVVHGVQPAIGAATAYRRVRAGWEDTAGAIGIGGTGKKIIPIFANAAGPLELLPNHRYGAGWLRVTCDEKESFQLPTAGIGGADPYLQIYLKKHAWWRLMSDDWINPVDKPTPNSLNNAWNNYEKMLGQAKKFHIDLSNYYHPKSYVHYGADDNHQAFHRITWNVSNMPAFDGTPSIAPPLSRDHAFSLQLKKDNFEGRVWMINEMQEKQWVSRRGVGVTRSTFGDSYTAKLRDQDQAGDGTVPAHAAEDAASHAIFAARMSGYDHQGSYDNESVKHVTLYSILRIAASAKELA
ncbi:esterase/lipase family protein [Pseudomonas idahonensis]|uniref:esterase/lipase family protein n=1 Tax=Pseudomonas idahonensis TaxID=2942628 RepID=UPI0035BF2DB7